MGQVEKRFQKHPSARRLSSPLVANPITFMQAFFDLTNDAASQHWRSTKLSHYTALEAVVIPVADMANLDEDEHGVLLARCKALNFALYETAIVADKPAIRAFGQRFGLEHLDMNLRADEDSITSLQVVTSMTGTHYIPYTNRPLNWHTAGYYNPPGEQVRGIIMHCAATSASGGDNLFLDPEMAYLLLRDANPDYIAALMQADAMTIPANIEAGVELRAAQSGPVFSFDAGGALHMRYTARTRSIIWKDDDITQQAVGFLRELLQSDSPCIFRHRLRAGQGIICNNILHKREAFNDDAVSGKQRLLYRARYHERIHGT